MCVRMSWRIAQLCRGHLTRFTIYSNSLLLFFLSNRGRTRKKLLLLVGGCCELIFHVSLSGWLTTPAVNRGEFAPAANTALDSHIINPLQTTDFNPHQKPKSGCNLWRRGLGYSRLLEAVLLNCRTRFEVVKVTIGRNERQWDVIGGLKRAKNGRSRGKRGSPLFLSNSEEHLNLEGKVSYIE